jgi:hypothetical protein
MRVLFLEHQPCIRALKYVQGFKNKFGDEIEVFFAYLGRTLTEFYGYGDELFNEFVKLDQKTPEKDIKETVRDYEIDLIHSHNAPDFLTESAIKSAVNMPIIHDSHDVLSLRKTRYGIGSVEPEDLKTLETERFVNEESDGRIYATEGLSHYVKQNYNVDPSRDLVFPNYLPRSYIPTRLKPKLSEQDGQTHIVYEGTVDSRVSGTHYDLMSVFEDIAKHKLHIHIYVSCHDEAYKRFSEGSAFIHYHGHLTPKILLQEMTKYDFGWAGLNATKNKKHLDVILPNKLFDYIACGLPVLSFPHRTQKRFIEEHGLGFVFHDIEELVELLNNDLILDKIRTVLKKRHDFTIEKNIVSVKVFYEKLLRPYLRKR